MEGRGLLLPGPRRLSKDKDVNTTKDYNELQCQASDRVLTKGTQVDTQLVEPDHSSNDISFEALLRAASDSAPGSSAVDEDGHGNDHDSLFSGESDIFEISQDKTMANNVPYYDNPSQLDISGVGMSLNGYDHESTSRYPEPSYQGNHTNTTELHNLVAAAHSVAEREQHQHRSPSSQAVAIVHEGAKRKQTDGHRSLRNKRRKQASDADGEVVDHADSQGNEQESRSRSGSAMLFRPATEKSKKWSRPAMETLYNSFHLPAETFIQLQDDAKDFMLDPKHPERKDLIGTRGHKNMKSIKVKLLCTVKQFLDEGAGEKYFSSQSEGNELVLRETETEPGATDIPGEVPRATNGDLDDRTCPYVWPQDKDTLIGLCTPLLRRIVTNERQRIYAESAREAVRRSNAGTNEYIPVDLQVFFVMNDYKGNAVITNKTQAKIPSSADMLDNDGKSQWDRVCTVLGLDALGKNIRIQTPNGLAKVTDQQTCGEAVMDVLKAPWLGRVVRMVVGEEEADAASATAGDQA